MLMRREHLSPCSASMISHLKDRWNMKWNRLYFDKQETCTRTNDQGGDKDVFDQLKKRERKFDWGVVVVVIIIIVALVLCMKEKEWWAERKNVSLFRIVQCVIREMDKKTFIVDGRKELRPMKEREASIRSGCVQHQRCCSLVCKHPRIVLNGENLDRTNHWWTRERRTGIGGDRHNTREET